MFKITIVHRREQVSRLMFTSRNNLIRLLLVCQVLLFLLISPLHATEYYGFVAKWDSNSIGDEDKKFYSPFGIATDSSGNVYVADTYNHHIQKLTSNG
jgi:DNA-binding beta-propeller fold protein YncE